MNTPDDAELRALFEALRADDRELMPEFHALVGTAPDRALQAVSRRTPPWSWLVAASVLVVATGVLVRRASHDVSHETPHDSGVPQYQNISAWTSPTAALLRAPVRQARESPDILSSVLDGAAHAASHNEGGAE